MPKADSAGFRVIEKDPQWTDNICHIHSVNSKTNSGYLEIANGAVTCTGKHTSRETIFKVYFHGKGESGGDALFECIGGNFKDWMLCVNSQNQLSTRKRTKEYINFDDAEDDVLFSIVVPDRKSSQFQIKWKKGDEYIGFDTQGQQLPLRKMNDLIIESLFTCVQSGMSHKQ